MAEEKKILSTTATKKPAAAKAPVKPSSSVAKATLNPGGPTKVQQKPASSTAIKPTPIKTSSGSKTSAATKQASSVKKPTVTKTMDTPVSSAKPASATKPTSITKSSSTRANNTMRSSAGINPVKATPNNTQKPQPSSIPKKETPKTKDKKPNLKSDVKSSKQEGAQDLIAEDKNDDKKKKKRFLLIFFLLIFIAAIAVACILLFSNFTPSDIKFVINIESEVHTEIYDENDNVVDYIIYYPGDTIDANMKIEIDNVNGANINQTVFLRFKIDIFVDNNYYAGLFEPKFSVNENIGSIGGSSGTKKWYVGEDGYFYYYLKCYGTEEIEAFTALEIVAERDNNVLNGKTGNLVFTVEILEGQYDAITQSWYTAPDEWRELANIKG